MYLLSHRSMCEPYQQIDLIQVPLYCHHSKFLLVEELALNDTYFDLQYGRCCVIGKIAADSTDLSKFYFENIRIPSLDKNYSLPEGAVRISLVTSHFRGHVPVGKVCEIVGDSILYNIKNSSANRVPLTSKDIVERINVLRSEKLCEDEYKEHLLRTYRPALLVDHIRELQKGAELIERNLEIRML